MKARPGLRVDTSHVDPLADSLSFVLPAVVQARGAGRGGGGGRRPEGHSE